MELSFESRLLRSVCEEEAAARKQYPLDVAETLRRRLADLHAADSLLDLVVGRPCLGDTDALVTMPLAEGYELVGVANYHRLPTLKDSTIDWARVRRLKIMAIERTRTDE